MGAERELRDAAAPARRRRVATSREPHVPVDEPWLTALHARAGNTAVGRLLRGQGPPALAPPVRRGAPSPAPRASLPSVQRFDPRYHRESVVEGLATSGFSAEEIGAIYGANWERDFSQAHPALGDVVLRWKALKVAAFEGRLAQADIDAFTASVGTVIDLATNPFTVGSLMSESYGGYRHWEHMDNPAQDPALAANPALRGELLSTPAGSAIPRYMMDAREYIKAQLYDAAAAYRGGDIATGAAASVRAAWAAREASLRAAMAGGKVVGGGLRAGGGPVGADAASREVALQAGAYGAPGRAAAGAFTPAVADALGRASHTLEDFFAHSNFVELAIGEPNVATVVADPTGTVRTATGELGTGTFGAADKKHALAHKLRAVADEIEAEYPLVERVTGRRASGPTPGEVHVGSEAEPSEASGADTKSMWEAIGWTGVKAAGRVLGGVAGGALAGGLAGFRVPLFGPIGAVVGGALGAWQGLRFGLRSALADVVATREGARMLKRIAERLEDESRAEAQAGSHTRLAKDQPGHHAAEAAEILKTVKFRCARALAAEADRRIIGGARTVLTAATPEEADRLLTGIYAELDRMIAPPAGHPLSGTLDTFRTELLDALHRAYPETTAGMGDLATRGASATA